MGTLPHGAVEAGDRRDQRVRGGGGLELACWADLRVVESDAVLGVFCRRVGSYR